MEVEAFGSEVVGRREEHGVVVDLSEGGFRLMRPWSGGPAPRIVQLELELPGIDEVIWAKGDVCFDQVTANPAGGLMRTRGIRLAAAAGRDARVLRDFVVELRRARERREQQEWLSGVTAFSLG